MCAPKSNGGMGFRKLHEMHLALLGKQAWRLIKYPASLVSRVYKARYFRKCGFLEAKEGSNPSFIWRGMLEVQHILRDGCRRSIGNGLDTNIGHDT